MDPGSSNGDAQIRALSARDRRQTRHHRWSQNHVFDLDIQHMKLLVGTLRFLQPSIELAGAVHLQLVEGVPVVRCPTREAYLHQTYGQIGKSAYGTVVNPHRNAA